MAAPVRQRSRARQPRQEQDLLPASVVAYMRTNFGDPDPDDPEADPARIDRVS